MTQILTCDPGYRPEMVTLQEAADRSGMNYYSIRRLCLDNAIVYIRSGKRYYVNWPLFVDFLCGHSMS